MTYEEKTKELSDALKKHTAQHNPTAIKAELLKAALAVKKKAQ